MPDLVLSKCKTLAPDNQFRFKCPVFNVETRIAACFKLREEVWRGDQPPVRRGCQCAMRAGKCPINRILNAMRRSDRDPYYSAQPKLGSLDSEILDGIAPVLVRVETFDQFALNDAERRHLIDANANATPIGANRKTYRAPKREKAASPAAPATTSAAEQAATTGDLSAAISAPQEGNNANQS
jgi:hypothetical protein